MRLGRTTVWRHMVHIVRMGSRSSRCRRRCRHLLEPICDTVCALIPSVRLSRSRCAWSRLVGHSATTATGLQIPQFHPFRRRRCSLLLPRRRRPRLQRELYRLRNLAARTQYPVCQTRLKQLTERRRAATAPAAAPSRRPHQAHPRRTYSRSGTCSSPRPRPSQASGKCEVGEPGDQPPTQLCVRRPRPTRNARSDRSAQ